MCRRLMISAALAVALAAAAAAQDPGAKPADPKPKQPDPTQAAVAAALRNDTDVKIAQAKVQLAEAELAKARQAVVLKVMTLKASIDEHRRAVATAEERSVWSERLVKQGQMEQRQLLDERNKLEAAKAALAKAETEYKLLTIGTAAAAPDFRFPVYIDYIPLDQNPSPLGEMSFLLGARSLDSRGKDWLTYSVLLDGRPAVQGPIPDRIRAALDKPVVLGKKGEAVALDKALEVFRKSAGLDVPVRGALPLRQVHDPKNPNETKSGPIEVVSEGEELPVGAWLQLFEDNAVIPQHGGPARYRFYVREYGLLISPTATAPSDAPTLTDFWKQKPSAKSETAPEPKSK